MRARQGVFAFGLALVVASGLAARSRAAAPEEREAAIQKVIAAQVEAWNRGDAKAHAADCREDVLFTNVLGITYGSRAAFEERHAAIFSTFFAGSRLSVTVHSLRFPRPDVALVDLETAVTGYKGLPPGVRAAADGSLKTRMLQVLVEDGGQWRVAAYHNVDVKVLPDPR
jgi:uncharacterized protein (TIGR02246 family)